MDPYLEAHWGDVHTRLVTNGSDQLRTLLPKELRPRVIRAVSDYNRAQFALQRAIGWPVDAFVAHETP